jgi:hypothetical protein
VEAVKNNKEIKSIFIYNWYDFPLYSEFHNSGINYTHTISCENMHEMFINAGYRHILDPHQRVGYTEEQAEDSWLNAVTNQGNQLLPEWILAPRFIN